MRAREPCWGQCQDADQAEPVRGGALTSVARGSQTGAPTSLFPDLRFGDLPEAIDPKSGARA